MNRIKKGILNCEGTEQLLQIKNKYREGKRNEKNQDYLYHWSC